MNIMKNIGIVFLLLLSLGSCTENEQMLYETKPGVYLSVDERDTIAFSFLSRKEREVLNIRIQLMGQALETPGVFKVFVIDSATTAQVGLHYEALPETITFPAGKFSIDIPVNLLRKGVELTDSVFQLAIGIGATDDLDVVYKSRAQVYIQLSNDIVKPPYWDALLNIYFGDYSKAKHQKCAEIMGHDFPAQQKDAKGYGGLPNYTYWMRRGREVCDWYINNPGQVDEYGKPIEIWSVL